ncbi:MAG TPA: zinc-binding dehydrogenase [Verrucomicrobiales bacterium]|nr:zinc-binding dehydrogenase [Verrucomicrobiales bacterium]
MPSSSRFAVIEKPGGPIVIREARIPSLEPGSALLRTLYSEVCGTDCHLFHGRLSGVPYPLTPGHVSVGEVVEICGELRDAEGLPFQTGEVAAFFDVHRTCGRCWHCLVAKTATRCPERRVYGITYGTEDGLFGGWSEFIHLLPGVLPLRLPRDLDPLTYIAGGCGMPTAFHAVERAGIRMGDTVAVQGCGPVGLCVAAFSAASGAARIVVLGAPGNRLTLARRFGADAALDIRTLNPVERVAAVRELSGGRGADVTIEASGNPAAIPEGMEMTRDGGVYVIAGQYTDNGPSQIHPHYHINRKHLDVRGCWGSEFSHFHRGITMMTRLSPRVPWQDMIGATYSLRETPQALEDVEQLRVSKAVIDPWKP